MHRFVGCGVEGIHVRLGDAGAGQADKGAGAERDDRIGSEGEAKVRLHGAILVAGTDGAEFEFEASIIGAGIFL